MTMASLRPRVLVIAMLAGTLTASSYAQDSRDRTASETGKSGPATSGARGGRPATGKGPLPDPTLLDGSSLPAEKKSEQGMLGDFELPGDDNTRSGKVGGQQQQMPQGSSGGQQMPAGLPQMSGGGAQSQQSQDSQGAPQSGGGGAPQAQNGQQPPQQGGGGGSGPNDPNAKAEGMQVGQMQTDPSAGGSEGAAGGPQSGQKPPPVTIGDKAMQIKGVSNAQGVVGAAVPAGQTQQMEKSVGGGKGSSAVKGGPNAAEKGRAIPAGL